jgi:Spy/CpxP family protein refolding chaperone
MSRSIRRLRRALMLLAALTSAAATKSAQAQNTAVVRPKVLRPTTEAVQQRKAERQAERQAQKQQPARPGAVNRPALERQVSQALARVVRKRLNLNDQQMQSLRRVDQKYNGQRLQLLRGERSLRQNLRAAMKDSTPDQAKISEYIDQLTQAQHQRADLVAAEQKELSSFLTPMQRAQYLSLREQVTNRMQQLAQPDSLAGGGRRGSPPPEN